MQCVIELIDNISPVGLVESPVFDSIEEIAFDIFEEQVEIKIVFGLDNFLQLDYIRVI